MTRAPHLTDLVVSSKGQAQFLGRQFCCAVGRGGFVEAKEEGDGAAPRGAFRLEFGLWRPDRLPRPRGALAWRPIRPWDGWSDDPEDPDYNRAIRRPHAFHHELLRRPDPLYDLVAVFDANRHPAIPGRGSALFLHVWRCARFPTEGCVAFALQDLLWILSRWRPQSRLWLRR